MARLLIYILLAISGLATAMGGFTTLPPSHYNFESVVKIKSVEMIQEKKCSKCGEVKDVSCFLKRKSYKDGIVSYCVECDKKHRSLVHKTKRGLIAETYQHQKSSSKQREMNPPTYNMEDLYSWCMKEDSFHTLFSEWEVSGYDKNLTPSIDRIDSRKSYFFENIRVVTWEQNRKFAHIERSNGLDNVAKAVISISKKNETKEYFSITEASKQTGISISDISHICVGRKRKDSKGFMYTPRTAGGYKWKFKDKEVINA